MRFYKRKYHEYFWQCYQEVSKYARNKNENEIALEAFEQFSKKYPNNEDFYNFFEFVSDQVEDPSSCDLCGEFNHKIIFLGLPMKLCANEECRTVSGLWSWVCSIYFDGHIMTYTGGYLEALRGWLFDPIDEDPVDM